MPALTADFFARPAVEVAPDLLGCVLQRAGAREPRVGRIVEVEAYLGDGSDPASHAHSGPTPRNRSMFGPPGRFYVYRSMGIHHCLNIVCQPQGEGAAVLIRALEPLRGLAIIRRLRSGRESDLTNGPGKLCQAFGVDPRFDGRSATRGELFVCTGTTAPERPIRRSPRIGISKATELRYRFFEADNPHVTPHR